MIYLRSLAAFVVDVVRSPRCRYGCGQRVAGWLRDVHERVNHDGDRLPPRSHR